MAQVGKLNRYSDLSIIGNHAERFGIDPDEVEWKCRFDTVIAFAAEQKERHEFRERFNYVYSKLQEDKK